MIITKELYDEYKKQGDGFCIYCKEIAWGSAAPLAQNGYCSNCENRGVVGIDRAIQLQLVSIR